MVRTPRTFIVPGLTLVLASLVSAAEPAKVVEFSGHKIRFEVPEGWKVVKMQSTKKEAHCLLQEGSKDKVKATICIWAGDKTIKQAPAPAPGIEGKNEIAAAAWANRKAMSLSLRERLPAEATALNSSGYKSGELSFFGWQSESLTIRGWGISVEERDGGPLTAGCASAPIEFNDTQRVLTGIIDEISGK